MHRTTNPACRLSDLRSSEAIRLKDQKREVVAGAVGLVVNGPAYEAVDGRVGGSSFTGAVHSGVVLVALRIAPGAAARMPQGVNA